MITSENDKITLIVPNNLMSLNRLHKICGDIIQDLPFDEKYRYFVMVALSEAYTNAYEHGNQKNPDSEIKLTFCVSEKYLKIVIEDDGIMPIQDIEVILANESCPEDTSGRGVALIRRIFDEVAFERTADGANQVTLISKFNTVKNKFLAIKES